MSSNSTTSTLQPHHLKNLLQILRRANYRYSTLATRIRASLNPTHHARNRAAKLGLGVDVQKAIHLDHRQVSVVPLPVIEQVISPPAPVSVVFVPLSSTLRPKLKCTIPAIVSPSGQNAPTSPISATLLNMQQLSPLELTSTETGDDSILALERNVQLSENSGPSSVQLLLPTGYSALGPDAPVDKVEDDWEFDDSDDELSSVSSSSTSGGFYYSETSGSTSESSTCILTPDNIHNAPLMIRIKRKSAEIRDDMEVIEKRPKFERKGWLLSTSDRLSVINKPGC